MIKSDYLVIGSGIAGLSFALKACKTGSVIIVTKRNVQDASTTHAQGGIAVVWSSEDSFEQHISDTIQVGAGLCDPEVVKMVVCQGPERIKELIDLGVNFTVNNDINQDFELGLEAGHSKRRILHVGDMTGNEIERVLAERVSEEKNIVIYDNHIAIDLITLGKIKGEYLGDKDRCWGAYVLDIRNNIVKTFVAKVIVLATGGSGKVYLYTSNPDVSTGDGVAMAYRCGATIANMEFVQFHPTCLYHPKAKSFLISEALRGEGAILISKDGKPFMYKYHPMKELAPRDIVARAIDNELKESGDDYVYLDITHKDSEFLKRRFPVIYNKCLEFGIDITKEPIPVVPAAHYNCGGVLTNIFGETSIKNLLAIGETACTGMHGSNRLASNSLLEALVFAYQAFIKSRCLLEDKTPYPDVKEWDVGSATDPNEQVVISQNWDEIRHFMWNYVGIVRTDKRLMRAARRIELLQQEITEYYWNFKINSDLIELRNIATVAELIIKSARNRKESRGLHYTLDYPYLQTTPQNTLINLFK